MIQESGPKNWSTYTWYQVGTDLGAGASAMIFDADILGYFMNGGDNKEKGNLGYPRLRAPIRPPRRRRRTSGSGRSRCRTSPSRRTRPGTSCSGRPRPSTTCSARARWTSSIRSAPRCGRTSEFRDRIDKSYPGYLEQHDASAPGAKIYFTPQPLFFDLTTEWAATLQKMVAKEVPVDEGLDKLADSIDRSSSRPASANRMSDRLPRWPRSSVPRQARRLGWPAPPGRRQCRER